MLIRSRLSILQLFPGRLSEHFFIFFLDSFQEDELDGELTNIEFTSSKNNNNEFGGNRS
jgi:hypothetical protein